MLGFRSPAPDEFVAAPAAVTVGIVQEVIQGGDHAILLGITVSAKSGGTKGGMTGINGAFGGDADAAVFLNAVENNLGGALEGFVEVGVGGDADDAIIRVSNVKFT